MRLNKIALALSFAAFAMPLTALAQEAAAVSGASTPMGALAAQLFALHNAHGASGDDFSSIVKLIRGTK